jgi:hypothetical protein
MYLRMAEVSSLLSIIRPGRCLGPHRTPCGFCGFAQVLEHALARVNLCAELIKAWLQERDMDLVEVLSFLFMLSTMELGQVYTPLTSNRWAEFTIRTSHRNTPPKVCQRHRKQCWKICEIMGSFGRRRLLFALLYRWQEANE